MKNRSVNYILRIVGQCAILIALMPLPGETLAEDSIVLTNVTRQTGIDFRHTDGSSGKRYLVETVASGVATFDYDGDGLIDIYFLNGAPLRGTKASVPPRNRLFRNLGGFRFADVTDGAGVGDPGYGLGVAVGDYDNDGHSDLYLSNYGPNVMYRNNGDGTFQEVTKRTGTVAADDSKAGAGACFLDMDADGDLDLFVANYIKFTYDSHVTNYFHGVFIYSGPNRYPPFPSMLYRNNGDGSFSDVSNQLTVTRSLGRGMGIVCADYDNDRDTDIFVGNDGNPGNFLFKNDGTGTFEDVGWYSGVAFDGAGVAPGSMGVACGDYDNDGWLDFFVTNYEGDLAILFRNLEGTFFDDVTKLTGAGQRTYNQVTWGCGLIDFDSDTHKDIFLARGHLHDNVHLFDDTTSYLARPVLLKNTGKGKFVDVTDSCGDGTAQESVGRGAAFADLDNDGRVDAVILNSRRQPTILRNESPTGNHWIQIRLCGVATNRDGIGAHVKVATGDVNQLAEVHSGHGYQSHFGDRLHFGLGKDRRIDRIEVHWIGGSGVDVLHDLDVDQIITITEGNMQSKDNVQPVN